MVLNQFSCSSTVRGASDSKMASFPFARNIRNIEELLHNVQSLDHKMRCELQTILLKLLSVNSTDAQAYIAQNQLKTCWNLKRILDSVNVYRYDLKLQDSMLHNLEYNVQHAIKEILSKPTFHELPPAPQSSSQAIHGRGDSGPQAGPSSLNLAPSSSQPLAPLSGYYPAPTMVTPDPRLVVPHTGPTQQQSSPAWTSGSHYGNNMSNSAIMRQRARLGPPRRPAPPPPSWAAADSLTPTTADLFRIARNPTAAAAALDNPLPVGSIPPPASPVAIKYARDTRRGRRW